MKSKAVLLALTVVVSASSGAAFAQATQPSQQNSISDNNTNATAQWVTPENRHSGMTRAQVNRELVRAEHDGQIARLDSTLYAHH